MRQLDPPCYFNKGKISALFLNFRRPQARLLHRPGTLAKDFFHLNDDHATGRLRVLLSQLGRDTQVGSTTHPQQVIHAGDKKR
jgi:hypothetical protein